jgi:hypothetical protein
MKGIFLGAILGVGLALAAPANAFDAQACMASYGDTLPSGLSEATLQARCDCVAAAAAGDASLAADLDAVISKPLSDRQVAMDENPKAKAAVEACRAQHP